MTYQDQLPDPVARLAAKIDRLKDRIAALERRGLVIPVLDADPEVGDPTTIWLLNDGRLRAKDAEGRTHEWVPTVDQGYKIKTLSSNPAASTGIDFWLDGGSRELRARLGSGVVARFAPINAGTSSEGGGSSQGSGTSSDPKPTATRSHQHRQTWGATNAASYCPVHGRENRDLYYGRWSSTHGERRVMFTFNDSDIRSTLSGATIRKVEMKVRNLHAYSNGGINIHWGAHNSSALDASFHQRFRNVWKDHWPKVGGDVWRTMPDWFGRAFRDGTIRGLTIDQPSTSVSYYGLVASGLDLRITYSHKH